MIEIILDPKHDVLESHVEQTRDEEPPEMLLWQAAKDENDRLKAEKGITPFSETVDRFLEATKPAHGRPSVFSTKDGYHPAVVRIGCGHPQHHEASLEFISLGVPAPEKEKTTWQAALTHEIAHMYLNPRLNVEDVKENPKAKHTTEIYVDCLAKSFTKPEYWDDETMCRILAVGAKTNNDSRVITRLPEINKGIRLRDERLPKIGELEEMQKQAREEAEQQKAA